MKKMVFRKLSAPTRPISNGWQTRRGAIVLSSEAGDLVTPITNKGVMSEYDDSGGVGDSLVGNNEPYFTAINAAESSIRFVFVFVDRSMFTIG